MPNALEECGLRVKRYRSIATCVGLAELRKTGLGLKQTDPAAIHLKLKLPGSLSNCGSSMGAIAPSRSDSQFEELGWITGLSF